MKTSRPSAVRTALMVFAASTLASVAAISCSTTSKPKAGTATNTPTVSPTCGGIGHLCDVAGQAGLAGYTGNGGPATQARLYWPQSMVPMPNGDLLIMDWNNYVIRKVDTSGTISTIAGNNLNGDTCGTTLLTTNLNHPPQAVLNPSNANQLYIAGWHNPRIKMLDFSTGLITCVAGTAANGFSGDGGLATIAQVFQPNSVDFDSAGNWYFMDAGNERIRKVDTAGIITTFVGSGTIGYVDSCTPGLVQINQGKGQNAMPGGRLAIDRLWNVIYFCDSDPTVCTAQPTCSTSVIRQVDIATGCVTTIAGQPHVPGYAGDGGPATTALLNNPMDVCVAPDHSLYISDTYNHVIRHMVVGGNITTVAGTGVQGSSPNNTLATQAALNLPCGVAITSAWTLYIADTYNHQIKKVQIQ